MPLRSFEVLFSLTVEHGFFGDGRARGLRFAPDAASGARLRAPWFAWRGGEAELALACDVQARDEAADTAPLRFLAWADDPVWAIVSEPWVSGDDRLLRFTTERTVREADGRLRLHKRESVGRDELRVPAIDARTQEHVVARRPVFELQVAADRAVGACVIRFTARRVFWTYYIQGGDALGPLSVVDAGGEMDFKDLGRVRLGAVGTAAAFRSSRPLPLRSKAPQRLQVREQRAGAERIVVRRLPGPVPRLVPVPGRRDGTLQAEIYVNL